MPVKGDKLPNILGVQDQAFRMPGPIEFPKMAYKKEPIHPQGYITKVIHSIEEQAELAKCWLVEISDIHALLESLQRPAVEEVVEEKPKAKAAK